MRIIRLLGVGVCLLLASCTRETDLGSSADDAGGSTAQGGMSAQGGGGAGAVGGSGLSLGGIVDPGPAGGTATERGLPSCTDCRWTTCADGKRTTVSGTVRTPAKVSPDPLYNAVVYVPGAPLEPFADGVTCDRCGNVSGKPLAAALSQSDGTFTLDDVPAGHDIPLVLQMGRWRREVVLPEIVECQDNALPEELTRFPRNRSEGDIPRIALVTSVYDPEECILRKMGIDDAEFTAPSDTGRIHLFEGNGALGPTGTPEASELWSDPATLARYDMVLLPCGSTPEGLGDANGSGDAARAALANYADIGGRVFTTDLSYTWITEDGSPFAQTANWVANPGFDDPQPELDGLVDTTFPKGQALAEWLHGIGATSTPGQLTLHETYLRSLTVNAPTQRWLYSSEPESLQSFTFNTPIDAGAEQQCGRFAYSSFHIAGANGSGIEFPTECDDAPLTPQERVLEFMLFDLASCVQIDTGKPKPPEVPK
jgi:hypothetical protein